MTTPPRLLGSYSTPTFSYGDVVRRARLETDVRITGLSAAPIPWPIGQTCRRPPGSPAGGRLA
jgi:hypothetical protein